MCHQSSRVYPAFRIHAHTAALLTIIVSTNTMHRKSHSIPNMKCTRTFCPFSKCDSIYIYIRCVKIGVVCCCINTIHIISFVFCPLELFLVYNFLPAVDNLSPSFFTALLALLLVLLLLLPMLWGRNALASTPKR